MRFTLIDRIVELEPSQHATAIKSLSLAEEYLQDHFPLMPVMPGVMLLEAMTQTAAWLIRASEDFKHSVVTLREARNVKYADFLQPGETLTVRVEQIKENGNEIKFKASGRIDGRICVSARLTLERYNLADTNPSDAPLDAHCKAEMRALFALLYNPEPAAEADTPSGELSSADA